MNPFLQVVEEQLGRDEALGADGEERWIGLPVPLGEAVEVRDWRLSFGKSDGVAELIDLRPHPEVFSSLAILFSASAGNFIM